MKTEPKKKLVIHWPTFAAMASISVAPGAGLMIASGGHPTSLVSWITASVTLGVTTPALLATSFYSAKTVAHTKIIKKNTARINASRKTLERNL